MIDAPKLGWRRREQQQAPCLLHDADLRILRGMCVLRDIDACLEPDKFGAGASEYVHQRL